MTFHHFPSLGEKVMSLSYSGTEKVNIRVFPSQSILFQLLRTYILDEFIFLKDIGQVLWDLY